MSILFNVYIIFIDIVYKSSISTFVGNVILFYFYLGIMSGLSHLNDHLKEHS